VKNNSRTYCFVTNLSFSGEPTVKNRLMPYIAQAIEQGFRVILVTSDSEIFADINSPSFTHILRPCKADRPDSFIKRTIFEWNEARNLLKNLNCLM